MIGRNRIPIIFILCAFGACGYVTFARPLTPDEIVLHQEIEAYYTETGQAFAAANPQALAELFSPSITHPMTQPQILAWGKKFFSENKTAIFHVENLSFDELGYQRAVVRLTYKVETPGSNGGFGGTERDVLVRVQGRWYISSWDKIP